MDEIEILSQKLDQILEILKQPTLKAGNGDLYTALSKAQGEMPPVYATQENAYFKEKYVDYGEMLRVSHPYLSKYGLSVHDRTTTNEDGQEVLVMYLTHESGQQVESCCKIIPPKSDTKTYKSYKDQRRKDLFEGLVGIICANSDDDGEYANATHRETLAKGVALNTKYNPKENRMETITKEQLEELEYELGEYDDVCEDVLDSLKIQNLADMPKSKFMASIDRIRKIKRLREEGR